MPRRDPLNQLPSRPSTYRVWLEAWKYMLQYPNLSLIEAAEVLGSSKSVISVVRKYGRLGLLTDEHLAKLESRQVPVPITMKEIANKLEVVKGQEPPHGRPQFYKGIRIMSEEAICHMPNIPQRIATLYGPDGPIGFSCLDCSNFMADSRGSIKFHRIEFHGAKPGALANAVRKRQREGIAESPFEPEKVPASDVVAVSEPIASWSRILMPIPEIESAPVTIIEAVEVPTEPLGRNIQPPQRDDGSTAEMLEDLTLRELMGFFPSFAANARLMARLEGEVDQLKQIVEDNKYKIETFDSLQEKYTELLASRAIQKADESDELKRLRAWKAQVSETFSGLGSLLNKEN